MKIFIEVINAVGVLAQVIIAGCALFLLYVSQWEKLSAWWGIRSFSGEFDFYEDKDQAGFSVSIKNNGKTKQEVTYILNNLGFSVYLFFRMPPAHESFGVMRSPHSHKFMLGPGQRETVLLDGKEVLADLEISKSLFVVNNLGRKKIASKKDIQRALEKYREHIKKRGAN